MRFRKGEESVQITILQIIMLLVGMLIFATIVILASKFVPGVAAFVEKFQFLYDKGNIG